jgi:hypothetical protein
MVGSDERRFPEAQLGPGGLWELTPDTLYTGFDVPKIVTSLAAEHPVRILSTRTERHAIDHSTGREYTEL